ncbi:saccharopine dehydrogenase NADP-binding domain-containing protein [Ramlibacter sp.]|uniref:saccharopine dehydrogenase NADP-binding domain-containing protein n=1 Tax=Ramlibacter sp. TaxID=1917967 RepID=UPI0017F35155|nr:saccharopine dehydrogenase NADP-binding domain-containing protein [Ramlibacter sp.]MBA2675721.1 saccharopine dehydrogenase NADP-binding domain-containing protein [Ramlibacter sp.]
MPSSPASSGPVLVFGAAGHTGRFIVAELRRRGLHVLPAGRDAAQLRAAYPETAAEDIRVVDLADAAALEGALRGASVLVNCAGPFADTTPPLLAAAVAARAHYVDITAEQAMALEVFERWDAPARAAGIVALPAMGFYGGLGNLLATVAMGDWDAADGISLYIALDSWHPTLGTRKTGERNTRRMVFADGRLQPAPATSAQGQWTFDSGVFGAQEMVGLNLADTVTMSRQLRVRDIHAWINDTPIRDLHAPDTPAPRAVDATGRSAQRFAVEVVVRRAGQERRARAEGQDIYAITAPLVAEACVRILRGTQAGGAFTVGQLFDARDFLGALSPQPLAVDLDSAETLIPS